MKLLVLLTPCLMAIVLVAMAPALAQNRIYRCGNEYTNQVKGRKDCKLVEGGNITVIGGAAPVQRAANRPASAPRVDTPEQRARDADAKAILEQELRRAEARQAELLKDYNNGEPDKIGGEARNYQKYLDRVEEMKAAIARNQSDIDGIKRELTRFNR
ncbi:MAG: DUF3450 domain-containing protein [Desulfovibrionaceae bacterium]|nr:DUF3450 domain-containing protein [Desulfovibrionaceae bacterium]